MGNFIKKIMDKDEAILKSIFLSCIYFFMLMVSVNVIRIFPGITTVGNLIIAIILFITVILLGKIFLNIQYKDLLKEIKLSKYDFMDNLLIALFFSSIFAFISTLIYQIDFMINSDVTKTIRYFMKSLSREDANFNSFLYVLNLLSWVAIGVAEEEVFFRFILYKVFVKKKEDIKIFIMISSIIFGLYHFTSVARFFSSLSMSIFLGIIYIKTKNLIYPFISHLLWNYMVSIAVSFMGYFEFLKNASISKEVFIFGFSEIIILCFLILLSTYAYLKKGYLITTRVRNKL